MGLRIGTNVASIMAANHLRKNDDQLGKTFARLSSGSRITRPGDDAAGYAIAESLRGQERGLAQARRNADSAKGLIHVAEGGLAEQNNIAVRLREIAIQAASDTVSDDEREFLNTEFQQLVDETDRIAKSTRYGKKQLLVGARDDYEFFVGTTGDAKSDVIRYRMDADTTSSSLGLKGLDVTDKQDAQSALEEIDGSLLIISQARASFGAIQERLEFAGNNLDVQRENVAAAHSLIADTDYAEETARLAQEQVRQDYGVAVLSQANQNPARAMKLLI